MAALTVLLLDWPITFLIMTSIAFYLRYKWNRRKFETMAAKIPAPEMKGFPIIGNLLYFWGCDNSDFIKHISEFKIQFSIPKLMGFWLGPLYVVGIFRPEDLEVVLFNVKNVDKSFVFSHNFNPFMRGAVAGPVDSWRVERKLLNKMFHSNLMEKYTQIFNEQAVILVNYLTKKAESGTFDISHAFGRCTLDIICRTALGVKMHVQHDESVTVPQDLVKAAEFAIERMYKPWLFPTFIFKMTEQGKNMFRCADNIHQFIIKVIKKRRKVIEEISIKSRINGIKTAGSNGFINSDEETRSAPYIDSLLRIAKENNCDDMELAYVIADVIAGGMDTSATTISYVMVMLGIHKDWQDKVHKEIDEIFGNSDRPATMSDIGRLVQLEMVIKEVLRLYSPPQSLRLLAEDAHLENYTLPAGTIIFLGIYELHRDEAFWSNPNKFYPEHFLPENISSRPKHSFLPFSGGPRGCPGSKYGMISMKILLSHVLRKFRVECDLKMEEMKFMPSIMLQLVGGYMVRLIPRQTSL